MRCPNDNFLSSFRFTISFLVSNATLKNLTNQVSLTDHLLKTDLLHANSTWRYIYVDRNWNLEKPFICNLRTFWPCSIKCSHCLLLSSSWMIEEYEVWSTVLFLLWRLRDQAELNCQLWNETNHSRASYNISPWWVLSWGHFQQEKVITVLTRRINYHYHKCSIYTITMKQLAKDQN